MELAPVGFYLLLFTLFDPCSYFRQKTISVAEKLTWAQCYIDFSVNLTLCYILSIWFVEIFEHPINCLKN